MGQAESTVDKTTSKYDTESKEASKRAVKTTKMLDKLMQKNGQYAQIIETIEEFIFDVRQEEVPEDLIKEISLNVLTKAKRHTYKHRQIISEKDSKSKWLYFILSGQVNVLSDDDTVYEDDHAQKVVIKSLTTPELFGELAIFWHQPTQTTVAEGRTIILQLSASTVTQLYAPAVDQLPTIDSWYMTRRYIPDTRDVDGSRILRAICNQVLGQIPLFSEWCEETLNTLTESLFPYPVVLYPIESPIVCTGDPGGELIILVSGRLAVFTSLDEDDPRTTFKARYRPFVIGEEGLFVDNWTHAMTLYAEMPCYIIKIGLSQIENCLKNVSLEDRTNWQMTISNWQRLLNARNPAIYNKYTADLQLELLYQAYCELWETTEYTADEMYRLARSSKAKQYDDGHLVCHIQDMDDSSMIYMIDGCIKLMHSSNDKMISLIAYEKNMVISRQDWMPEESQLFTVGTTIIMLVPGNQDITELSNQNIADSMSMLDIV